MTYTKLSIVLNAVLFAVNWAIYYYTKLPIAILSATICGVAALMHCYLYLMRK